MIKKLSIIPDKYSICIEGNIAVGKSTIIEKFEKKLCEIGYNVHVLKEEIDYDLLEKFNNDPKKYASEFQISMMKQRLKNADKVNKILIKEKKCLVLMDTGILREIVFSKVNFDQGNMTSKEYDEYKELFTKKYNEINNPVPRLTIILDCSVNFTMKNIISRGRDGEEKLTKPYLKCIKDEYLAFWNGTDDRGKYGFKIGTIELGNKFIKLEDFIKKIEEFVRM